MLEQKFRKASAARRMVARPHPARHADFDLHGLVGIRVLDWHADDRSAVGTQLGLLEEPLNREPDIVIRFVDRLDTSGPLRQIGVGEAAFDDDAFIILRSRHKAPAKVRIDLDAIGRRCEIVCERGVRAIPLLLAIINLTVLAKGGLALHATAFRYEGRGVLVAGWSKSGKTETLLAFLENGAEYVGDEWIYLSADGATMFGIPEPVRVWDWHLAQLPHYLKHLRHNDRLRLAALRHGSGCLGILSQYGTDASRRACLRVLGLVDRQRYAFLRPEKAFLGGAALRGSTIDHVLFMVNAEVGSSLSVEVRPEWVAERMIHSLAEERAPLMGAYRQFRFAFPSRANVLLETAASLEAKRLPALLAGRSCHAVYHSYPPSIRELFDTIAPLVSNEAPAARAADR
jgi:hypothetical protein